MSATVIAQTAIQYIPQAISVAKSLIAKFAPQIASTVEATVQAAGSVADSGIAQNILQAKDLISSDASITNKLFGLSTHLSETHPEIASKLEGYAIKLLNKTGLSNEEISFLHDQVTKISSFVTQPESTVLQSPGDETPQAKSNGTLSKVDVHEVIDLLLKGNGDRFAKEELISILENQTVIPKAYIEEHLLGHPLSKFLEEPVINEAPPVSSSGTEQNSNVSILDGFLTNAQQKTILEVAKTIRFKDIDLSKIIKENLPLPGTQDTLSILGERQSNFFQVLTSIATGEKVSLLDYKTTISSLLGAFQVVPEDKEIGLNHLHNQYEISIAQAKPKQVENTDSQGVEAKPTENKLPQTKEELESLVQERIASAGHSTTPGDENPIGQILHGVSSIVLGEFSNMSSEVGWLMKFYLKSKGVENLDQNTVKSYLNKFTEGDFIQNLTAYLKSSDKNEALKNASEKDQTAIKWIGNLVSIGAHTPSWVLDTVAMAGTALDYTAEILHHVPVIGRLLKIPFLRKGIVGISQFAGRFTKDIKLIKQGAENLIGVPKPETVKTREPELATAVNT